MEKPEKRKYSFMSHPDVNLSAAEVKGFNECKALYDKYLEEREVDEGKILTIIGNAQDCPYCSNQGWYEISGVDGPEQGQCQWCNETPTSKFNLATTLAESLKKGELWKS